MITDTTLVTKSEIAHEYCGKLPAILHKGTLSNIDAVANTLRSQYVGTIFQIQLVRTIRWYVKVADNQWVFCYREVVK